MIEHNQVNQIPFSEQALQDIKRKLNQYEKFLNSNLDDLMSQSQDISLFERISNMDQESHILPIQQQSTCSVMMSG